MRDTLILFVQMVIAFLIVDATKDYVKDFLAWSYGQIVSMIR